MGLVVVSAAALLQLGCAAGALARPSAAVLHEVTDERFEPFLREMAGTQHFCGVVLIERDGKVLHAKGYGPATRTRPNDIETRLHVGSITKEFTAAAVMQLVEKGVVELDAPINRYLPATYRSAKWDAITVRHLLSHMSGIRDYAVDRDYYHAEKGFVSDDTVDGMVREAMSRDLEFAPGSAYSYTNLGYTLLGIIISNLTNTPYASYIQRHVLDPMGMTSSSIHVFGRAQHRDEAWGLRWKESLAQHVPDDIVSLPATQPDGGLITTLGDFHRWARIFSSSEQPILTRGSIDEMSRPQISIGNGGPLDSMGFGLFVGDRLIGHSGLVVGFSSQFVYDRETRSLIAVFSNDIAGDPQQVTFGLLTILLTGHR